MERSNALPGIGDLLWRISANDDERAYRLLFERYYASLCLFAKRYIEDKSTREDIVQDVFFSVWEKRKDMAPQVSAKNYLMTCVKYASLNYLRKQGYAKDYMDKQTVKPPMYAEGADELFELQELQDMLEKTLEKLPEEYRLAFIMSRFDQKNVSEIAETMGISTRTVERYRNRAIEILKEELKHFLLLCIF
ncbi:MAG: RNA polymerase sigma-70 factor [Tannerellaceae bacterium]|jgi:RNA polymerase sigma-70 factor (ECF subfamily)|nr:RNA polymerase sigma-70 factor [Tannerellaceae bacterium]